jgi:hypothetical protein
MLIRNSLIAIVVMAAIVGCRKDEGGGAPPSYTISDFSLLEPGNYWIYQRTLLDSSGNPTGVSPDLDSIWVSGTAMHNGEQYAVLSRAYTGTMVASPHGWRRDSADCVVDSSGVIIFRYGVFDKPGWSTYVPGYFEFEWTVTGIPVPRTVPAGTFSAYYVKGNSVQLGALPPVPDDHESQYWMAPNVGKVREELYYALSGTGFTNELVRYYVQ